MDKTMLTWKNVFNSNLKSWWSPEECASHAKQAGYRYFCWNGTICMITDTGYVDTVIDVNSVQ